MTMGLRVVTHADARAFLDRAEPWLLEHEAEHNLVLSIAMAEATSDSPTPDAFFATVEEGGEVVGASFRTPPHKLSVSRMPLEAVPFLMDAVSRRYDSLPAVLGPKDVAEAAAETWTRLRGGQWTAGMRQRVYRIDTVIASLTVPGSVRLARQDEVDLVIEWMGGFASDTSDQFAVPAERVRLWIDEGGIFLWDEQGPVSMARAGGETHAGMRVGFVYTPPEHRRRGYATALVAAVSQAILDEGFSFCVLYTDLSNPTSNSIYPKIGYAPLVDMVDADIVAPTGQSKRA